MLMFQLLFLLLTCTTSEELDVVIMCGTNFLRSVFPWVVCCVFVVSCWWSSIPKDRYYVVDVLIAFDSLQRGNIKDYQSSYIRSEGSRNVVNGRVMS